MTETASSSLANLNWGGPGYPTYDGLMSTATVTPPAGSPPAATPPAATPSPAAPSAGSPPAGTPPAAAPAATGTPSPNEENLRIIRESHERLRELGGYEAVKARVDRLTSMETEALTVGQKLQYSEQEIRQAFEADPTGTLAVLRREAREAQAGRQREESQLPIQEQIRRAVEEATKPFNEQMNVQRTQEANQKFNTEAERLISEDYKDGLPPEVKQMLLDWTAEVFKYDQAGLVALKEQGQIAPVAKAYAAAKEAFLKAYTGYESYQRKKSGAAPPGTGGPVADRSKMPTIDDIIDGSAKAEAVMPSLRRG